MKEKILLFLYRVLSLILIFKVIGVTAQMSNYTFSQNAGTYTELSSPTVIVASTTLATWDDGVSGAITIPFAFQMNGADYTSCRVNYNGYITFGATAPATNNITPISSNAGYSNAISALGMDLFSGTLSLLNAGREISYATIGTAPNRTFVVQWKNVLRKNQDGNWNFQIRLQESSNKISFVYGTCTTTSSTILNAQVGLRGASNTDFNNRNLAVTAAWLNNTTAGTVNSNTVITRTSSLPASGTTFVWTPYCTPVFNTTSKDRLYINSFQFLGVLNNPPANVQSGVSAYANGYQDYTSLTPIAEQPQGAAVNVIATRGTSGSTNGTWKAWVDWNKDGDFNDVGEEVYNMISFVTSSVTFGFVIPASQPVGNYRLRIGTYSRQNYNFAPCETLSSTYFGEMEDYLFTVVTDCAAKVESVNSVNEFDGERCGSGSVRLSAIGNASAVTFNWYDSIYGGTLLGTGNIYNTPSITTTTTYYVTAVSSTGCETAFRYPVEARIDPNPTVTFSTSDPAICGEDKPSLLVTAAGDKYQDEFFEDFSTGLGVFTNDDTESVFKTTLSPWLNKPTPYIPKINEGYEGLSPAMSSGYFGGNYAMINSDIDRTTAIKYHLVSSNRNVNGFLNLQLDFDLYHFSIAYDNTEGYIEVSYTLDGSVSNPTWVSLVLPGLTTPSSGSPTRYWQNIGNPLKWQHFSVSIPGVNFTSTNFKIRFTHFAQGQVTSGTHPQKFYEAITTVDNVRLSGFKTITTPFSWSSPTVSLYDAATCSTPVGSTLTSKVCVKPSATELEDVNWALNASATFSNGCPAIGNFTVNNDTKTWRQTGITDWNLGAQWKPLNVPDITNCVIVRTPVELPTNTNGSHGLARSVIVKPGGSLIIQPKSSLTIQNHIKNETAATDILVQNDANLIQNNNSATNSANITVRRNANLKRLDYNYWGAPVAGQMLKSFSPNTLNNRFMTYNEADDFFYPVPSPSTTPFTPGTGYAIRADTTYPNTVQVFNGQFVGSINNGVITTTINCSSCTETLNGNNLIANPYPSNIDFDALQANNASLIYRTAYFWTNFNPNPVMQGSNYPGTGIVNNYAVYNASGGVTAPHAGFSGDGTNAPNLPATPPNRYIKVGQGFIVKAKTSGTLTFNNSIRTNDNSAVFLNRQANNQLMDRFWLSLKTPLNLYTPILIAYVKGATNNYELDYDAELLTVASDSFYSDLQGKKLAIQGKYPFANNDAVVLGARFYQNGNYTIGLDKKEGIFANGQSIYLKDNYTGIVTNLSENSYQFNATAGEVNDRFEILYTNRTLGNAEVNQKDPIVIYKEQNGFVINSNETISSVKLFDATGRLVNEQKVESKSTKIIFSNTQKGVFLVEIITPSKRYTKKIIN